MLTDHSLKEVGYCKPPASTRFKKGQSGNPRGRPRKRRRDLPYDNLLGQMVTVREGDRERRVTAAEAFLLQLTRNGLAGDSAAARASLEAIEKARAVRPLADESPTRIRISFMGLCHVVETLGIGVRLNPTDKDRVRLLLKPWVVQAALNRLGARRLSVQDQKIVVESTRTPEKVQWPDWWKIR